MPFGIEFPAKTVGEAIGFVALVLVVIAIATRVGPVKKLAGL